ncbi:GTP-binding protein At3g49725, chloroplastic [Silene latifolia]|uniref:GTP-binding protein At3g49725, chloroplastic n=1 Tax=Silene latifolia TaxID=37657 RepID=UPI003D788581
MINKQLTNQGTTFLRSKLRHYLLCSSPINPLFKTLISPISTTPSLHQISNNEDNNNSAPKLLVVQPRIRPITLMQSKLSEAINLANSLDQQRDGTFSTDLSKRDVPPHIVVQNPLSGSVKSRSDTYFGPGTVENIKCHMNAIESTDGDLDAVFVNAILSAVQQRNLERKWEIPVLDRVGLIIEIFHAHAYTKEAKLQAELAALMYKKSRLVRVRGDGGSFTFGARGEAEVVSARGRGSGGQGFISGAGETELELQRRRISDRRKYLLGKIEEVRKTRAVQRAGRRKQGALDDQGIDTIAIVGYTNAGKSTLVGALSESDLYSDDRLFATVDPRVRGVTLPSGRKVLLSDTVGFISDLPVQLIDAFHATLEEVVEADLLVHVLDSSAINLEEQRTAVLDVLRQIGVSKKKIDDMIEVWNKIDLKEETGKEDIQDDCDEDINENGAEIAEKQQLQEHETMDYQSDDSKSHLEPGVEHENEDQQVHGPADLTPSVIYEESRVEAKDSESQPTTEYTPQVKTSAVTGVGLRQLLEVIDEKLVEIDKERQSETVVQRSLFDRKWRPPQTDDTDIAVGQ